MKFLSPSQLRSASYAYDQLNRPLTATWTPAPAQTTPAPTGASFNFGYDATNRRIGQSATDKSWWSYPAAAASVSYTANNLNQYTTVGSVTPTYDGNGNLTSDGTFTYGYDAENRLISASGTGLTASYAHDAQGRRKSKTVNGTTTIAVTDADNREVLEYDGSSGALSNWYSFAPANAFGPDAVLNQMNVAGGTRATFIPDILGSIVGSLDAASGTLSETGYQTYGENPSLTSGTYQYTARRFDPETAGSAAQPSGLYYYRARMYSPAFGGRFMQVDPIGYVGGSNLYAYVANDPLNNADPKGLWFIQIGVAWFASGFLSGGAEFGVAIGTGGIATYTTSAVGTGVGQEVAIGPHLSFAPTGSVANLTGYSTNVAITGGEATVAGVDITLNPSGEMVYGLSFGTGGGAVLGQSATFQYTISTCWTCATQSNPTAPLQLPSDQNPDQNSSSTTSTNSAITNGSVATSGPTASSAGPDVNETNQGGQPLK